MFAEKAAFRENIYVLCCRLFLTQIHSDGAELETISKQRLKLCYKFFFSLIAVHLV